MWRRAGRVWFADHPIGNTVQLADGKWHNILGYRVRINQPTGNDAEFPTPATGSYIEEVISSGQAFPRWSFE